MIFCKKLFFWRQVALYNVPDAKPECPGSDSELDAGEDAKGSESLKLFHLPQQAVLSHVCSRWFQVARILDELPDKNISYLESLTLESGQCDGGPAAKEPLSFSDNARYPYLHILQVLGPSPRSPLMLLWSSLRTLDMTWLHLKQCLYILWQCISLQSYSFGITGNKLPRESKPVHHPNLSVLYLSIIELDPLKMFLRLLSVPNLTSFTLRNPTLSPTSLWTW